MSVALDGPLNDLPGTPGLATPLRPLILLGGAVLLAHLAMLQAAPGALNLAEPLATRQFITRTITPPPPAVPAPVAVAARPEPAAPAPAPVARPRPAAPKTPAAPVLESNVPGVQVQRSSDAINSVAINTPANPAAVAAAEPSPPPEAPAAPSPPPPSAPPAAPSAPVAVPAPVRLQYMVSGEVRKLAYTARSELSFVHDATSYQARLEVSAFLVGARSQTSVGSLTPGGLAPTRFADKSRAERAAHFDRERARISFSANTSEAPLLPGAQDRLSVLLQLAALLAGDPARYPAGSQISIQTAGPTEAEPWLFAVEAEERQTLPVGELATIKLTRAPRREFDQRVEIWLAPSLGYLPARVRITQANGDFVDQQLRASGTP